MAGEQMKYPYSLAAKIRRFPFHHYFFVSKNGWLFRYWALGILICMPLYYKVQKASFNPANVEKWKKIHEKQFSGEMHH